MRTQHVVRHLFSGLRATVASGLDQACSQVTLFES
jgi:hypothetical protein